MSLLDTPTTSATGLAPAVAVICDREALAARASASLSAYPLRLRTAVAGPDALAAAVEYEPCDLVVIGLAEAWRTTLGILRRRLPLGRRQPIVAIVADEDQGTRMTPAALHCGVRGVVPESRCDQALAPTVRGVLAGQVVAPFEDFTAFAAPTLSHRERQVLALVALGHSNGRIADYLFLAESTVKSHLTTIFAKLGVSSRSEAAARALDTRDPVGSLVHPLMTSNALEPVLAS